MPRNVIHSGSIANWFIFGVGICDARLVLGMGHQLSLLIFAFLTSSLSFAVQSQDKKCEIPLIVPQDLIEPARDAISAVYGKGIEVLSPLRVPAIKPTTLDAELVAVLTEEMNSPSVEEVARDYALGTLTLSGTQNRYGNITNEDRFRAARSELNLASWLSSDAVKRAEEKLLTLFDPKAREPKPPEPRRFYSLEPRYNTKPGR